MVGHLTQHLYASDLGRRGVKSCIVCPVHYSVDLAVLSVEPNPRNFDQLLEHDFAKRSDLFAWYGIEAGLGKKEGTQLMALNPEFAVDEIGSLLFDDNTDIRTAREEVSVVTLETAINHATFHFSFHRGGWRARRGRNHERRGEIPGFNDEAWMAEQVAEAKNRAADRAARESLGLNATTSDEEEVSAVPYGVTFPPERPVFLLKLDIEGYEPLVLRQSRQILAKKLVKFIVFEYSENAWHETLQPIIDFLNSVGYFCFLITRSELFPISFEFWTDDYLNPVWSNVFCGVVGDPDLDFFVELYHREETAKLAVQSVRSHGVEEGSQQEKLAEERVADERWDLHERSYLMEYTPLTSAANLFPLARAKELCLRLDSSVCGGITCVKGHEYLRSVADGEGTRKGAVEDKHGKRVACTLRVGKEGPQGPSPIGEFSYVRPRKSVRKREHPFVLWRKRETIFD